MSDTHNVAPGGGAEPSVAPAPAPTPAAPTTPSQPPAEFTTRDAARALAARRVEKAKERAAGIAADTVEPDVDEDTAMVEVPQQSSADAETAAPEKKAPGEEQTVQADPAEEPPIEPPRSWTREAKEQWQSLPRDTQEYLATREQERDREVRRSQNEAAEFRKAIEAERQAVSQARQQYETALPSLLQTLQAQQMGEFGDIKSIADVERLATEDWPRYARWDAAQKKIAAVQQEWSATQQRQSEEYQQQWSQFASQQDAMFAEKVPEYADKDKASKLGETAISVLRDKGFNDQELGALWHGQSSMSLRDHRTQLLILDAVRYRDGLKAAKAAAAKPVPPVQRPGVARPRGPGSDATLQALSEKLSQTGSPKDAAKLITARRLAGASRR